MLLLISANTPSYTKIQQHKLTDGLMHPTPKHPVSSLRNR